MTKLYSKYTQVTGYNFAGQVWDNSLGHKYSKLVFPFLNKIWNILKHAKRSPVKESHSNVYLCEINTKFLQRNICKLPTNKTQALLQKDIKLV